MSKNERLVNLSIELDMYAIDRCFNSRLSGQLLEMSRRLFRMSQEVRG